MEWTYTYGGVLMLPATTVTPGYYGAYSTAFPSPSSGTNYPSATANIGWTSTNKDYFADYSTGANPLNRAESILPGSIGPINFYPTDVGPY
jgi:hypothetical protein